MKTQLSTSVDIEIMNRVIEYKEQNNFKTTSEVIEHLLSLGLSNNPTNIKDKLNLTYNIFQSLIKDYKSGRLIDRDITQKQATEE